MTFLPNKIIVTQVILICFLSLPGLFFAQESTDSVKSDLKEQARLYRSQGLALQGIGNIDEALSLYQKAVQLDPHFIVAYNDMGILYEAKGMPKEAEKCYLKAIELEPGYLSSYSNLALLYESQRNFEKAARYWQKRIDLGSADDPWTEKAKERLDDLFLILGNRPQDVRERQVAGFMRDVAGQKQFRKVDRETSAQEYFTNAQLLYKKGKKLEALKEALRAQQLDPGNSDIEAFVEKVQRRLLVR
jgi:tetratricopeptide (TPR) repeat protein